MTTTSPSEEAAFEDVMIDIETLSLHPSNALILSIGMIEFDPTSTTDGLRIGKRALIVPDIAKQLWLGRHVDPKTQAWWKAQPSAASDHWMRSDEHWALNAALMDVHDFCLNAKRIWANGTQFDLSNLIGLNAQIGTVDEMWHYRAPRDMRTFCEETSATRLVPTDLGQAIVDHEPVSDCITQAWRIWSHWQEKNNGPVR